jgi:hypothetical protein
LESSFQVDANNDGIIGSPFTTIESQGNTTLFRNIDGKAFIAFGNGSPQAVTSPWGAVVGSQSSEWQMLGAETLGGVNQVLFRNNSANLLHTWTLDANWNWTASGGLFSPSSTAGIALQGSFGLA